MLDGINEKKIVCVARYTRRYIYIILVYYVEIMVFIPFQISTFFSSPNFEVSSTLILKAKHKRKAAEAKL